MYWILEKNISKKVKGKRLVVLHCGIDGFSNELITTSELFKKSVRRKLSRVRSAFYFVYDRCGQSHPFLVSALASNEASKPGTAIRMYCP